MKWTKEEDRVLREGREQGKTFSEIGALLGKSRNSIAGRTYTLGLSTITRNNPVKIAKVVVIKEVEPSPVKPKIVARSVPELTSNQCKWPIGMPGEKGFHFCSDQRKGTSPYCQHHYGIAYYQTARR